jgi:hypothetical protein
MVFDFVLGTVGEFVEYAQIIVAIFFAYYVFKFFTFEGPDAGERRRDEEKRIDGVRGDIEKGWNKHKTNKKQREDDEKADKQKARDEHERERLLGKARKILFNIEIQAKHAEKKLRTQDDTHLRLAKTHYDKIQDEIDAVHTLLQSAYATIHHTNKVYIRKLITHADLIKKLFNNGIVAHLPSNTLVADWNTKISEIQTHTNELVNQCGTLADSIDEFIEDEKKNSGPATFTPPSPTVGAPPPVGAPGVAGPGSGTP